MRRSGSPPTAQGRRSDSGPTGGRLLLLALALALLAALPYLHGIDNGFVKLDDDGYVTENPQVARGLTGEGVLWAFTTFHRSNWHPLTWLSHMADVSLFGLDPRGHHAVSILLHALTTGLLFIALVRLTGAVWPSAFAAALFGVHPLHVESVAWVSERKDLLAGLCFVLVLLAYERYARRGGAARLGAAALLLALGLTAKPMLVTIPFVLLLLDVWPLGRTSWAAPADGGAPAPVAWGRLLLEKTPLLALSAASSAVTFLAQQRGGAVSHLTQIPVGVRAANAAVSYAAYLGKTVWPTDLAVLYPHPMRYPSAWVILGSVMLLGAVSWGVLALLRRAPFLAVGGLWFLGMLVPVIGVVQVGVQAMADRYTYLPLIGIFLAVAWGAPRLVPAGRWRGAALGALAGIALALLSGASWGQVSWWKDSVTLFRRTLALTSGNWLIENNLGFVLIERGAADEALPHLREALRVRPDYAEARNNLGIALALSGKTDEAAASFREALRLRPDLAEAHYNLANALRSQGRLGEAAAEYRETLRLRPDQRQARQGLSDVLRSIDRERGTSAAP